MLNLATVYINPKENLKKQILSGFLALAKVDSDFNGDNGIDYVSDEAQAAGYDSNCEYLIESLKKSNSDVETMVRNFFKSWIDSDPYYYEYYYEFILKDASLGVTEGNVVGLALAVTAY